MFGELAVEAASWLVFLFWILIVSVVLIGVSPKK